MTQKRALAGLFFVYVDRTDDGRPFYVGKGTANRVYCIKRNKRWRHIAAKHGHQRDLTFATADEQLAFAKEKELIALYDTFAGWGANFTAGGEGPSGRKPSAATIAAMRVRDYSVQLAAMRAACIGRPASEAQKRASSENLRALNSSRRGVPKSAAWKAKVRGKRRTEEQRQRYRDAWVVRKRKAQETSSVQCATHC